MSKPPVASMLMTFQLINPLVVAIEGGIPWSYRFWRHRLSLVGAREHRGQALL